MTYNKGEYVQYALNGVCLIEDIKAARNQSFPLGRRQAYERTVGAGAKVVVLPDEIIPTLRTEFRITKRIRGNSSE